MAFFSSNNFLFRLIIIIIIYLPFVICDLYFGYNDDSCIFIPNINSKIDITLGIWLRVDGYLLLTIILNFLILFIAAIWNKFESKQMYYCFMLTNFIQNLFRLIWLVVAAVIFWGQLVPQGYCSDGDSVGNYMWANLIIGFILSFATCIAGYNFNSDY